MDKSFDLELEKKFTPKRLLSDFLARSYLRLGYDNKASRVASCGTFLEFKANVDNSNNFVEDSWRLTQANFCRDRLCPMCSWRRSFKIFGQVSQIMDVIENDYSFIFLTLTVPNCQDYMLCSVIDDLQSGFRKLTQHKRFKNAVCGHVKVLEITRNIEKNTYHPHFHVILAVPLNYFTSNLYINHAEWLEMWRKAMKNPNITQVDVRRCKPSVKEGEQAVKSIKSAVAEVAKYSVKSSDILGRLDKNGFLIAPYPDDIIDSSVLTLSGALYGRRLTAFGGIFKDIRKRLNLDDCEDGDLINIDSNNIRQDLAVMIFRYKWSSGAYKLIGLQKDVNVKFDDVDDDN